MSVPIAKATTAASPYLNKPLRTLEQAVQDSVHRRQVEGPVERLDGSRDDGRTVAEAEAAEAGPLPPGSSIRIDV